MGWARRAERRAVAGQSGIRAGRRLQPAGGAGAAAPTEPSRARQNPPAASAAQELGVCGIPGRWPLRDVETPR